MKANKHHIEALLNKRDELKERKSIADECINKSDSDNPVKHWHEIESWILQKSIDLMEKAIIDCELEDF